MDPKKVLRQLYIGIGVSTLAFAIVGAIFMRPVWLYLLSILAGGIAACFLAYNMYDVLDRALELEANNAKGFVTGRSLLRLGICLLLMVVGIKISWVSFVGVTVGLLGLKISAFLNPVVALCLGEKVETDKEVIAECEKRLKEENENPDDEDDYEDMFVEKHFGKYSDKVKNKYR